MRLALCALAAGLLSGCSWLGIGGHNTDSYATNQYGYSNYGYGNSGCLPNQMGGGTYGLGAGTMTGAYGGAYGVNGAQGTANMAYLPGCTLGGGQSGGLSGASMNGASMGGAGLYGMSGMSGSGGAMGANNPYGASAMYGVQGQGGAQGLMGAQGLANQGQMGGLGQYGAQGQYAGGQPMMTTLGSAAPYGSMVGGGAGSAMPLAGGQIPTIQGSPIYVPDPYMAAPNMMAYGTGAAIQGLRGASDCCDGLPFGLEAGIGTGLALSGDIFPGEKTKKFLGGPGNVSDLESISYGDAFGTPISYDVGATYDLNERTTLVGRASYLKADGQSNVVGSVDDGAGLTEDVNGQFSDLEQVYLEGGVRQYFGKPYGLRPYVGAMGGAVKTNDVTFTRSSETLMDGNLFTNSYVEGGWSPTASGLVGAEWALGPRTAIGVETGVRWTDSPDTQYESDDAWSIPVKLRGRVAF